MHFVYILKDRNQEFYIGYTKDLERRVSEHKRKEDKTYSLIYYEAYTNEAQARSRERKLKHYGSAWRALKKRMMA